MQLRNRSIINIRDEIRLEDNDLPSYDINNYISWFSSYIDKMGKQLCELNALGRYNQKYIIMEKMRLCHELYYMINTEFLTNFSENWRHFYNVNPTQFDRLLQLYIDKSTVILQQLKVFILNNLHDGIDSWSTKEIRYTDDVFYELEKCKTTSLQLIVSLNKLKTEILFM